MTMDEDEIPIFNNVMKLCESIENLTCRDARSKGRTLIPETTCSSCIELWKDSKYYNWGSQYTRSSYCSDCQESKNKQDYISYWGSSRYRVGSWRIRQKWINPDLGWLLSPRSLMTTSRSHELALMSKLDTSWSEINTPRSQNFTSRSGQFSIGLECVPSKINENDMPDMAANDDANAKDNLNLGSFLKISQQKHRSKSPCLKEVDISKRRKMFENPDCKTNQKTELQCHVRTVDYGKVQLTEDTVIPKLNLKDMDTTSYNSPVYHFPLTPKPIPTVAKPNRWVGYGHFVGAVELTSDCGHLLWVCPRGELQVIFRYEDTGQDFSCFLDPQYKGVRMYQRKPDGELTIILDGQESPHHSSNQHHVLSSVHSPPQNNFKLVSYLGRIELLLRAIREENAPNVKRFKINYTMTL